MEPESENMAKTRYDTTPVDETARLVKTFKLLTLLVKAFK